MTSLLLYRVDISYVDPESEGRNTGLSFVLTNKESPPKVDWGSYRESHPAIFPRIRLHIYDG